MPRENDTRAALLPYQDLEEAKVKAEALEIEKAKLVKQSTETTKKADALQREYDEKTRQLAEERERSIQLEEKTTTLTEELKKKEARLDAQTKKLAEAKEKTGSGKELVDPATSARDAQETEDLLAAVIAELEEANRKSVEMEAEIATAKAALEKAQAELSKARADLFARDPNALAPPKPTEPVPTTPSRKKKKSASVTAAPAPVDADKVETQRLTEALERKEAQLKDAEKKASTLEGELAVVKAESARVREQIKKAENSASTSEKDLKRQIAAVQAETDTLKLKAAADKERLQASIESKKAALIELEKKLHAAQEVSKNHEEQRKRADKAHAEELVKLKQQTDETVIKLEAPFRHHAQLEESLRDRSSELSFLQAKITMHKEEEAKRAASPPTSRSPETARLLYDAFIALHRATASKLPLPTFTPSKGDDASAEISLLLQAFKTLLASLPQERITLIEAETRLNAMREAHAADHARHAVELARERNRITKYEASIRELEQKLAVMTSRSNATSRWASTMAPPMSWRAREPGATWVGATAAPTLLGRGQVAAMRHLGAMVTRLANEQKEVVEQQVTMLLGLNGGGNGLSA